METSNIIKKKHNDYMRNWRLKNRDKNVLYQRKVDLKRNYGISKDVYDSLFIKQSGLCAICGNAEPGNLRYDNLCVDHAHDTKKIRGLLCHKCNRLLGDANDGPVILKSAIQYLKRNS